MNSKSKQIYISTLFQLNFELNVVDYSILPINRALVVQKLI